MGKLINTITSNKRLLYLSMLSVLVLFCVILNVTFSAFTASENKRAADITVGELSYSTDITGNIVYAPQDNITKFNMTLTSNNNVDTKYELTYTICTDSSCNNTVSSVSGLKVEYSSRSANKLNGDTLDASDSKAYRIVITNPTNTDYYIKIGVNAGFKNNPLVLQNMINPEYSEEDLTIYTYINDAKVSAFPTTANYVASVSCHDPLGGSVNATGTITWDSANTKWVLSIAGLDTVETRCDVKFYNEPIGWANPGAGTLLASIKSTGGTVHNDNDFGMTVPGRQYATGNEGLRKTVDDYGYSIYYRGAVDNNYVIFSGMCWRIVRIDGFGNIKLVLYNRNPNSVSNPCATSADGEGYAFAIPQKPGGTYLIEFNGYRNKNTYIGYMYSNNPDSSDFDTAHANDRDSTISGAVECWYNDQQFGEHYNSILADVIWCGDKSVVSDTTYDPFNYNPVGTGLGTDVTYYQGAYRLSPYSSANPSLVCPSVGSDGKLSKYTAEDTVYGNAQLYSRINQNTKFKIGLLTADEVAFAGSKAWEHDSNTTYYLYNNTSSTDPWWTMTPYGYLTNYSDVWAVMEVGGLMAGHTTNANAIRPAIALKPSVTIATGGTGTSANPFVISA